jgi:hypothetical protein
MSEQLHATSARLEHAFAVRALETIAPALDGVRPPATTAVATRTHPVVGIINVARARVASGLERAAVAIAPGHVARKHAATGG